MINMSEIEEVATRHAGDPKWLSAAFAYGTHVTPHIVVEMCALIRKQEQAITDSNASLIEQREIAERFRKQAETREAEIRIERAALADAVRHVGNLKERAPSVPVQAGMPAATVNSERFRQLLYFQSRASSDENVDKTVAALVAHIDAHTAQERKAGYVDGYAKATVEHNQRQACVPEPAAAPQQHAQSLPMIPTDDMCRAAREKMGIGSNVADHVWRVMASAAGQNTQQHAQAAQYADNGQQHEDPTGPNHPGQHDGHTCEAMGQMLADFGSQRTTPEAVVARMDAQAALSALHMHMQNKGYYADDSTTPLFKQVVSALSQQPAAAPSAPALQLKAGTILPSHWISEVCGPEVDDLSYGQGYRAGFNDCRATVAANLAAAPAIQQEGAALDERAEFEKNFGGQGFDMLTETDKNGEHYALNTVRAYWVGWSARAALAAPASKGVRCTLQEHCRCIGQRASERLTCANWMANTATPSPDSSDEWDREAQEYSDSESPAPVQPAPWSIVAEGSTVTLNYSFASAVLGALFNGPDLNPPAFEQIKNSFATIMRGEKPKNMRKIEELLSAQSPADAAQGDALSQAGDAKHVAAFKIVQAVRADGDPAFDHLLHEFDTAQGEGPHTARMARLAEKAYQQGRVAGIKEVAKIVQNLSAENEDGDAALKKANSAILCALNKQEPTA